MTPTYTPAVPTPPWSQGRRATSGDLGAAVLDALPMSLYVVDRDLRVVFWNAQRERGPFGQPRQAVLGRPLAEVLPAAGYRATEPLLRRVLTTGQPHEESLETDGGRRLHVRRLPIRKGRVVTHVVSWFEDVTERSALELRVIASDRLAFLGQLVAGVAHEISNPLAGIAGCAEVLASLAARGPASVAREAREFRKLVRDEVARCERLVKTLLGAARPQPGRTADLGATTRAVLRLLERHPAFARVKVVARLGGRLPPAEIDADSLKQVVVALAINAAQAMPGGGTLTLRGSQQGGGLALDVIDTGRGVPPECRARIFEPFFRADPSRPGSGLGLAIARSLVRSRGGDILLRPRRGPGAAFRVLLREAEGPP